MSGQSDIKSILQQINDYDFEHLIADLWAKQGWETRVLQASNDRGIDVEARRADSFEQKHLIQVKRYSADNKVGSEMVQQYASLRHQEENVDAVIIITTSDFTRQAKEIATDLNLKLINGSDLVELIEKQDAIDIVNKYISTTNRDINNTQNMVEFTNTPSLQTLNPDEVPNIYVSKLVDNAIGDSVTESRLSKLTTGIFPIRTTIKKPILGYLYRTEQPHFTLQCTKIRLPDQELLNPPNNSYFVATDHRIFIIIGDENEDDKITIPYRQINDTQVILGFSIHNKIEIVTEKGPFKFAIVEENQEMNNCVQYMKEMVYSLI
jgi:hypothetical protein